MTEKGWTGTSSRTVVPDPVMRWPKPVQSSISVMPGVSRGTKARVLRPVFVVGHDRDPMREEHAGRVELAAVEPIAVAVARQARGMVLRGLGARLGQRVEDPLAGEDAAIEEALLLLACPAGAALRA